MKELELIKKIQAITGIENFKHKTGRTSAVVNSKMLYCKFKREVEGLTYSQIASNLGLSQHGSVMHLISRFDNYAKYDKTLRANYNSLDERYANHPLKKEALNLIEDVFEFNEEDIRYILDKMSINIKVINSKNITK
jgi:hypothetical protein